MDFLGFDCISGPFWLGSAKSTTLFTPDSRRNGPPAVQRREVFNEGWRRLLGALRTLRVEKDRNGVADDPFEGRIVVIARRNCWAIAGQLLQLLTAAKEGALRAVPRLPLGAGPGPLSRALPRSPPRMRLPCSRAPASLTRTAVSALGLRQRKRVRPPGPLV